MIDIHSHILPGIDDGAADLESSLEMARLYVAAGFKAVAATPHATSLAADGVYARSVRAAVVRLREALRRNAIDLRVAVGMEAELNPGLPRQVAAGAVITLADRNHLLVETPFLQLPLAWPRLVFDLAARGITVIFAHPERSGQLFKDRDVLAKMVEVGAKLQVNWDSFAGAYGRRVRHLARHMARQGLIHCLATDSHDPVQRHPGRVPEWQADLTELIGEVNLRRIALENPLRALRGLPLQDMDRDSLPVRQTEKNWFMRWVSA